IPADVWAEAENLAMFLKQKGHLSAIPLDTWLACDSLKRLWRRAHPEIVKLWAAVEDAARSAINGRPTSTHGLTFDKRGAWLRIGLPSGRYLSYPSPRVDETGQITYMGVCPYSRKWKRLKTFGGKLVENIVQAIARDVLANNMAAIEAAGYEIVLTVHDEVITEAINTARYNASELSSLLAINPSWAQSMPLAAAGFEADRYRKD
ncbi:hypothetical protein, partial [Herbiconiux daphne]|nr:hypothetical protein [Herbiconiux daphne]